MEEKSCSKCKVIKPTNQFRRLYDGYRSECKECFKEYINLNKETIKAKKAEYYKKQKEKNFVATKDIDWQAKYKDMLEENKKLHEIINEIQAKEEPEK